ncbi:MAG: AmmeMemoRadiSam system radical SAM enzyme [Candidatus Hydrothermarchaeaceae archaeon]
MLWSPVNGKIKCGLCARQCLILEGKTGFCRVRKNREGKLYSLNYALASSVAPDPIEKKPLFHFYPGTLVFSLGTIGCNFRCPHCQNYSISQASIEEGKHLTEYSPEKAVALAKAYSCRGIAWTYNEPTIWFEYTYDSAKLAKKAGLYTVYVTNGYITREGIDKIAPYLDAMNIDVKGFTDNFYRKFCSAKLQPVLDTVERAVEKGIHVELTYLMIPGKNTEPKEVGSFVDWVEAIDVNIPVHFTRFHPDYKMLDVPATPLSDLENAREIGLEELRYVYTGNIPGHEGENTYCYNCGEMLIERQGFRVGSINFENKCPKCGKPVHVVLE